MDNRECDDRTGLVNTNRIKQDETDCRQSADNLLNPEKLPFMSIDKFLEESITKK